MYQPGDYVYPTDLPQRLLCRVTQAESLNPPGEAFQILGGSYAQWGGRYA